MINERPAWRQAQAICLQMIFNWRYVQTKRPVYVQVLIIMAVFSFSCGCR